MPKKKTNLSVAEKERIAAQLLAASEGLFSTAQAMKTAGLKTPERSETSKKRVYRKAQKIKLVGHKDGVATLGSSTTVSTPRQLLMEPNTNSQLSVSSLSAPPSNATTTSTTQGPGQEGNEDLRRQLVVDKPLISNSIAPRKH